MQFGWLFLIFLLSFSALAETSIVKVKGYDVEYEIKGDGKNTILLEAGGSASLSDWDPIFESLASSAKVIRYSRIGNGGSEPIKKNYSSEEYAQEAALFLDALKIKKPVVYVAHSYGAYVARRFAFLYPEKIAALMLIEPASEHDVDIMRQIDLVKAEKEIAQIKLDDLANGMSNQYLDFWSKRPLPDYPQIADIPVTVIASIKNYSEPPVLFFTAQGRKMWGKLHSDWANAFPQGKVILTEKSYHYPQNDEPEMVVSEIFELMSRIK
ncbi:alpha/beta fold hydrolase [Pseudoalteromonas aurantia]|uniref:Alpha/beta hydrolase n=2 Tax=Pseudoalteromonas aurantia TaxID=43654 RepID=A0ABY2W2H2_9GAMM|nr:alpha/beta hydrolase [Pseudoalteromonas aurantia]TMO62020.1 alpha/beta hydrolase [Pseudoalteromonas aurantia]TMO78447.1 alpha/beta hydrolase [Pseudoalteromonas aurantia]